MSPMESVFKSKGYPKEGRCVVIFFNERNEKRVRKLFTALLTLLLVCRGYISPVERKLAKAPVL